MRIKNLVVGGVALLIGIGVARSNVDAQRGGGGPARTARVAAPVDLTGTWVSVVSEDWRWRMVTPLKNDVASVPINGEGRRAAGAWDLDRDNAANLQCKAFGVGGVMRQPGRMRISWQDDNTLKLEFDAGTQTRLLYFNKSQTPPAEKTWQGFSLAEWQGPGTGGGGGAPPGPGPGPAGDAAPVVPGGGGRGLRGGPPPKNLGAISTGAAVKVITTGQRDGYLRKNGVPYSDSAVLTEFFDAVPRQPNGDDWLVVSSIVDDPRYLTEPFVTSTHFKREADGRGWHPTPCSTRRKLDR